MWLFNVLCCMLSFIDGRSLQQNSLNRYHVLTGIPRAYHIYQAEFFRIVGGKEVSSLADHPHQVGLVVTLNGGFTSVCGASLISITRILTAAHCWWDGQIQAIQFTVVLGSLTIFSGGTRLNTRDVVVHPSWNPNDIINDIAMVKVPRVNFNANIKPIALPKATDVNKDFSGMKGVITGYGKISDGQSSFPPSTRLYQNTVNIITNEVCQQNFEMTIHSSHMCTSGQGGVGTCDGDSGGPLTVVWNNVRTQVGIVSFGLGDGCQRGYPSVYTRITAHLSWINSNL
ncbi:hypothetical protein ACJJTC_012812 [Scirpophaga incertulas]